MPDPATVTAQIAAVKDRFPDYWREPDALVEVSALWGGSHNECGVFSRAPLEMVAEYRRSKAQVSIAESPAGLLLDWVARSF